MYVREDVTQGANGHYVAHCQNRLPRHAVAGAAARLGFVGFLWLDPRVESRWSACRLGALFGPKGDWFRVCPGQTKKSIPTG
jgi:hypothetical protein